MPQTGTKWPRRQRHRFVPRPGADAQYLAPGQWHQPVPLARPINTSAPLQAAVNSLFMAAE